MEYTVRLTGTGRVEVAAYGLADAEHLVEKEITRVCPDGVVEVLEVARAGTGARIAEEFVVRYRVRVTLSIEAESGDEAKRAALRRQQERFAGSRYQRTAWDEPVVHAW
ncbi:MAG TPA: hypothetical protein VFX29_02935 [Longimicrobiaceae bacterium]|nr:hypothetical protein [Longimicrobiaceae bacterium]